MKRILILSAILIFACSSDSEGNPCIYEPTLTTEAVSDITETSATLNGVISIVSENCDVPNNTEQGFVYSTEIQPTLEDTQVNVNGTNISTTIDGLTPNTTYYVRAFLTNNLGDFYGDEIIFSTEELDLTPPVITIIGDNPLEINIGEDYTEFGATATDDIDGDITQDILIDSSNLNTALAGNYAVTYSVSDLSNNSTSEIREVIVIDNSIGNCDGVPYDSIVYGTQEWTVENACHTTYRDGTPIPQVTDNNEWANLTTGAWCYYDNDPNKGVLYNWYAVAGVYNEDAYYDVTLRKEFAPEGWHVPCAQEWFDLQELFIALGYNYSNSGFWPDNNLAKAMASKTGWLEGGNVDGTPGKYPENNNISLFDALPIGLRGGNSNLGNFSGEGLYADFWCLVCSSQGDWSQYTFLISRDNKKLNGVTDADEKIGNSVRLVKD